MVTSLLSLSKNTKPCVKLHSLHSLKAQNASANANTNTNTKNLRIIHFIRHAEGYHNVNNDYKNPAFIDAQLTPKGIDQCKLLSRQLQTLMEGEGPREKEVTENNGNNDIYNNDIFDVECIIFSPMRRALQTAQHSFEHQLQLSNENKMILDDNDDDDDDENNNNNDKKNVQIPFVACEEWRETVNYLCDQRLPSSQLNQDFPFVNFDHIQHEHDPIWEKYEQRHGTHDEFTKVRESKDDKGLRERAESAWKFIGKRNENCIAVVSHSAFFMHIFTRPELGIVSYEDDDVEKLMTEKPFKNCEMRSLAFEVLSID